MVYKKRLVFLFIQILFARNSLAFFKVTKMECRNINKTLVRVDVCRLKAVKRDIAEATIHAELLQRVNKCNLHAELQRKYNTYQPFLINHTFDICAFMESRKQAIYLDILFKMISRYTNANHTCPYEGKFIVERFIPLHENLLLPIPSGDYLIKFGLYNPKTLLGNIFAWFSFREQEKWEKTKRIRSMSAQKIY